MGAAQTMQQEKEDSKRSHIHKSTFKILHIQNSRVTATPKQFAALTHTV